MIRVIQQSDIFAYSQYEAECEPEAALNMMTGRNLMEVYYHSVPVFRCNMGHSIEDDVFFCRINFKGNTAFVSAKVRKPGDPNCCPTGKKTWKFTLP